MYWHMTDPRSDDNYGQPDIDEAAPAEQQADFLMVAGILFLISFVLPVVLLLSLLWRLFAAVYASFMTKFKSAMSSRRKTRE